MSKTRAFVFANGSMDDELSVRRLIHPGDFLAAVDGGLRHLDRLGLQPDLLIGDMDSADPERVQALEKVGVRVVHFPRDKDETDLELALREPAVLASDPIVILGALGGRLDQTLGNIALLLQPGLSGRNISLDDGSTRVFLIRSSARLTGSPGDTVSLIPILSPASGIRTEGLKYPLNNETLFPEGTRGISNVMTGSKAAVSIGDGILLCIHIRRKTRTDEVEGKNEKSD